MDRKRRILLVEVIGTVFIIFVGSALHFTYALSGNNSFAAFFSAVNESVWEHLKLAFWPSLFWLLIAMVPLKNIVGNFFAAKAVGAYVMVLFIPAVFYSYTSLTAESIFAIDIATFIVAVVVGQIFSYKLYKRRKSPRWVTIVAIIAVILLAIIFVAFTFYPPHFAIFQDSQTGNYGI